MRKSNAFRPTSLDSLESRIALSGAGLGSLAGAAKGADSAHVSGMTTEKGHHGGAEQGTHAHQAHHHATHHHHEHKAPR